MEHYRTELRRTLKTLLTGLESTGVRVYRGRSRPVGKDQLPCLLIYPSDEACEVSAQGGSAETERRMIIVIEAITSNTDPEALEDDLDTITAEVETVIGDDPTLGGKVLDAELTRTDWQFDEGETIIGRVGLSYTLIYYAREGEPGAAV